MAVISEEDLGGGLLPVMLFATECGCVVILVLVILLCACKEKQKKVPGVENAVPAADVTDVIVEPDIKKQKEKESAKKAESDSKKSKEADSKKSKGKDDPKKSKEAKNKKKEARKSKESAKSGTWEVEDGQLDAVAQRHSNGVIHGDNRTSGGLDRALPDLPAPADGAVMATDEEDDDDGLYDIIQGRSRPNTVRMSQPPVDLNHPYAKVTGEPDSDITCPEPPVPRSEPLYSGVDGENDEPDPPQPVANHAYAVVNSVGDATYADIHGNRRRTGAQANLNLAAETSQSTDTLDENYATVPPPVPDKNFGDSGDDSALGAPSNGEPGNSPSLPPRNGTAMDMEFALGMAVTTGPAVNGASVAVVDVGAGAAGPDTSEGSDSSKKGPRYSKVTARESIESLRQRNALPLMGENLISQQENDSSDANYATVDYDEIKSPGAASEPPRMTTVRESLANSELYAEIPSGEMSTRSSMYAQVGDFTPAQPLTVHAPTPPPVEALKRLQHITDEEDVDPGYSSIGARQGRPRSEELGNGIAPASTAATSGRRSPVYAIVQKKTSKRQTIHVEEPTNTPGNMYAEVTKRNNGARPKVKEMAANFNAAYASSGISDTENGNTSAGTTDPGYQTIGSVSRAVGEEDQDEDPDYASVRDSHLGTYDNVPALMQSDMTFADPQYESVADMSPGASAAPVTDHLGNVAVETNGNQPSPAATSTGPRLVLGLKREHIYQEINDVNLERFQEPK